MAVSLSVKRHFCFMLHDHSLNIHIMPIITNINGTTESTTTCICGSWLNHWKNFSMRPLPHYCSAVGCFRTDLVGTHVQFAYTRIRTWLIIPLCNLHNASKTDLDVSDTVQFVQANKSETCEKY